MGDPLAADTSAWPAPAKLNLFLHVTGRREDGYHELQTVFQFLDRCDFLHFRVRADGEIHRTSDLPGVPAADDIVVKAARHLREISGAGFGADIAVQKNIPMGGGLGGGSSDAATTLVALNHLWRLGLSNERLAEIGLRLGADVPIFVYGHAAWAEGVGEQFTAITLEEPWYLVVHPGCHISTAEIFAAQELTRDTPRITMRRFMEGQGRNDCEPVVRTRYPAVAEALDYLEGLGISPRMTGTGACVFARFATAEEAQAALGKLPDKWNGFAARGLNRSPLLDKLTNEDI
jgi:4-diphosphocytidyl-2-C-methyl-D-erythritol kinase